MTMLQLWMESIQQPGTLALLIILSTYILEDAAIISAALLSADGMIAPELAFLALTIGIATGDIGLYGMGVLLKRWRWLVRWINTERVNEAGHWLEKKMISTILLVRIIPGLRLPTYLACGFFQLPFTRFFLLVILATIVWTGGVFSGLYLFGAMFWAELSPWKWLLIPVLIAVILIGRRQVINHRSKLRCPR